MLFLHIENIFEARTTSFRSDFLVRLAFILFLDRFYAQDNVLYAFRNTYIFNNRITVC